MMVHDFAPFEFLVKEMDNHEHARSTFRQEFILYNRPDFTVPLGLLLGLFVVYFYQLFQTFLSYGLQDFVVIVIEQVIKFIITLAAVRIIFVTITAIIALFVLFRRCPKIVRSSLGVRGDCRCSTWCLILIRILLLLLS